MERDTLNKSTLSKACDIPYTTIDGWYKKGYEGLKLTTLRKLANFFGTSLDFWASEQPFDTMDLDGTKKSFSTFSVIMEQLNEDGQKRVLAYAEDLIASGRYSPNKLTLVAGRDSGVSTVDSAAVEQLGEELQEDDPNL